LAVTEFDPSAEFTGPASSQKVSVGRQVLTRERNDRISSLRAGETEFEVFCECGQARCRDRLVVTREVYEKLRRAQTTLLVDPSHVGPADRTLERHGRFSIVERLEPVAPR